MGVIESIELDFPEGKVRYGNLICPAPHNLTQRHGTKLMAATALLASAGLPSRSWEGIRLTADAFGKPLLSTDTGSSPVVSFSWEGDRLWAALSLDCRRLGIDAALPRDFAPRYPFARAFGDREGERLSTLCDHDSSRRAAMLWSAKEAVVKMLGCGFHLFDPGDVVATVLGKGESAWHSDVTVSNGAKVRNVRVYSIEQSWGWISFALGNEEDRPYRDLEGI